MIRLREYLADPEVFLSPEVQKLSPCLRILFHVIFFATDGAGRFFADAAMLRTVLYHGAQQQVSKRDVQAWLVELHKRGFIKLYTEEGTGYGKVTDRYWRQRDVKRKVLHPDEAPPDPGGGLPGLSLVDLPDELNRREGKGKARRAHPRPPLPAAYPDAVATSAAAKASNPQSDALNSDTAWIARLQREFPGVDIIAQLAKAHRKRRGDVERGWFEKVWLPGVTPMAPSPSQGRANPPDEPTGWREELARIRPGHTYEGNWSGLPESIRTEIETNRRAA
jgi:hypothetical protein